MSFFLLFAHSPARLFETCRNSIFNNLDADTNPWPKEVWCRDYRTTIHHTVETKTTRHQDLIEFIACYNPLNLPEPHELAEANIESLEARLTSFRERPGRLQWGAG